MFLSATQLHSCLQASSARMMLRDPFETYIVISSYQLKLQQRPSYSVFTYVSSENKKHGQVHVFTEAVPHTNKYLAIPYTLQLSASKDNEIWTDFHN